MSSGDYRVMAIFAEHMGIPPVTLVDEIVNAVNEIMQKALRGVGEYLRQQRANQLMALNCDPGASDEEQAKYEKEGKVYLFAEIESGLLLFDTLCHSHLDLNFDKFEVYTLRNILTIPKDLVDGGWIRLKHHEHLKSMDTSRLASKDTEKQILHLVHDINMELNLRKLLRVQVAKAKIIVKSLKQYKKCAEELVLAHANSKLTPEVAAMLREDLDPMNDNVYYLLTQVSELLKLVLLLNEKLLKGIEVLNLEKSQLRHFSRESYIEERTQALLEKLGEFKETVPPLRAHLDVKTSPGDSGQSMPNN